MSPFQIVLLAIALVVLSGSLWAIFRGWVGRREIAFVVILTSVAAAAIIRPDLTTWVAKRLGIGRGADLLLYGLAIMTVTGFFMMYARIRQLRRDVTALVRHLAIREAATDRPTTP